MKSCGHPVNERWRRRIPDEIESKLCRNVMSSSRRGGDQVERLLHLVEAASFYFMPQKGLVTEIMARWIELEQAGTNVEGLPLGPHARRFGVKVDADTRQDAGELLHILLRITR